MALKTMFPAFSQKPQSQYSVGGNLVYKKTGFGPIKGHDIALLRDSFNLSTWILVGCVIQAALSFIFPRSYAAFPAIFLLGWGIVDAFLMVFGLKENVWSKDVIDGKWSVAYPDAGETDTVTSKPGDSGPGAVMILGTRSNSPLGMFADGYKEIGDRFRDMLEELEDRREESGFMGMSSWISAGERSAANEYATISYWRSIEDIHQFALSPVHRDAWNWWNSTLAKHKHLGIMHEIFALPEHRGWEGIYINYQPTGLGATTRAVQSGEKDGAAAVNGGQKLWVNPIVDARRGAYRTSTGRMNRGDPEGKSNEKVAPDPYDV